MKPFFHGLMHISWGSGGGMFRVVTSLDEGVTLKTSEGGGVIEEGITKNIMTAGCLMFSEYYNKCRLSEDFFLVKKIIH